MLRSVCELSPLAQIPLGGKLSQEDRGEGFWLVTMENVCGLPGTATGWLGMALRWWPLQESWMCCLYHRGARAQASHWASTAWYSRPGPCHCHLPLRPSYLLGFQGSSTSSSSGVILSLEPHLENWKPFTLFKGNGIPLFWFIICRFAIWFSRGIWLPHSWEKPHGVQQVLATKSTATYELQNYSLEMKYFPIY